MQNTPFLQWLKSAAAFVISFAVILFPGLSAAPDSAEIALLRQTPLALSADFTITAHAGAMHLPDNSAGALLAAVSAGFDAVEMDLSYRPDGTPIIIHSSAPGPGEGLPLDDALAIVALSGKTKVNLDNKSLANLPEVYRLVVKHGLAGRVFFTGVDESIAALLQAQCPLPYYLSCSIPLAQRDSQPYAQQLADRALAGGFLGINCDFGDVSPTVVDVMHQNGLLVSVWTVNNNIDLYRMLSLSVDNITTREPGRLKLIIRTWDAV